MWRRWTLWTKILVVTAGVVLPLMAVNSALTVRMSRASLEDDIRTNGLTLARELATSAASGRGATYEQRLQREIRVLLGKGRLVREAAVYATGPQGLVVMARGGESSPPGPEEEIAARENREVVAVKTKGHRREFRVVAPVVHGGTTIGVVSLGLPLERVDALAQREGRQAIGLDAATVIFIIGGLLVFLNQGLTIPVRQLLRVMRRAESGDLAARASEGREDEVGQLARGLNRMLERVGSFQAELALQVGEATAELRALNQRLYMAQQQVAHNERLAAAGELAAAMAHDVGTPLTAVSGHLQLLEEEVTDQHIKGRLRAIQGHVDRVVVAAQHFLDSARPELLRAPVDVNVLLEDLLVLTSPEHERRGITVTRNLEKGLSPVVANPSQMQQLFLNLITNALDAMAARGTLTVSTEAPQGGGSPSILRVTITDTGPGMPPEVLAHAFDPFFTTRGPSGGTGLGLAICHRIAKNHGGTIRLESAPQQGTRAIVELPVREK